jgi:hypothetical protein
VTDRTCTREQEDWYRWFHERKCGLWKNDVCPIVQRQRKHVQPPEMRFMPEAIWGNPENPTWFMGINPGHEYSDNACARTAERRACANTVDDPIPPFTLRHYINRHDLVATFDQDEHHPVFADRVTSAALGLLLDLERPVCVDDPDVRRNARRAAVERLTIVNMAHCKCPSYGGQRFSILQQRQFWQQCGSKNLDALLWYNPRLLVLLGTPPKNWLWDLRPRPGKGDSWELDGWQSYSAGRLKYHPAQGQGREYRLLFLPHPSSRRGCYDPRRALLSYRAAMAELGRT